MTWVGVAVGGASLIGGLFSANASKQAASEQANAANQAAQLGYKEFQTITGQEKPYMQAGYENLSALDYLLGVGSKGAAHSPAAGGYGSLLQPFTAQYMKQYSPAYQFQLQQGQQGVLNQNAPSQGALSGAALKDLLSYNQNYANTAFNNAFNQYQTQQGNTYNRLAGIAQLGQTAAANTGQQGTALTGQIGQSLTNIGTAQAAGTIGAANALSGGFGNAALLGAYFGTQAGGFGNPNVTTATGYENEG